MGRPGSAKENQVDRGFQGTEIPRWRLRRKHHREKSAAVPQQIAAGDYPIPALEKGTIERGRMGSAPMTTKKPRLREGREILLLSGAGGKAPAQGHKTSATSLNGNTPAAEGPISRRLPRASNDCFTLGHRQVRTYGQPARRLKRLMVAGAILRPFPRRRCWRSATKCRQ